MLQTNPRRYRKATKGKIRNGEKTNGNGHSELQIFSIPKTIIKRDGRIVPFEISKIENAIAKCFKNLKTEPNTPIPELARRVVNIISAKHKDPSVENVQDAAEVVLQAAGEFEAAKHYILYRAEHAKLREERPVPTEVKKAFEESDKFFPT